MKVATIIAVTGLFGLMAIPQQKTNQVVDAASASSMRSAVAEDREAWQDFKGKDADAYTALFADNFTAVEIDGKGPQRLALSIVTC